ncbi:MAG: diaminopimelate epimerase [Lentisphaeria bacterium]
MKNIPLFSQPLHFSKLHAAGNDFICIDNTRDQLDDILHSPHAGHFVRCLTTRGLGIGADGLLAAYPRTPESDASIRARFLEPDGTEAHLCGNGTACFTFWAIREQLVTERDVYINTKAGTAHARAAHNDASAITVCVPDPKDVETGIEVETDGKRWQIESINTGVPHGIIFCDNVKEIDVPRWGAALRNHQRFAPQGINVNFVDIQDVGKLVIRTFEYGVENETWACGTGAAASAIMTCMLNHWPAEYRRGQKAIQVQVRSDESLYVSFVADDLETVKDVCLETTVTSVYDGTLDKNFLNKIMAHASSD